MRDLSISLLPVRIRDTTHTKEEATVKYALLIHSSENGWESLSDDEKTAIYGEYTKISESPGIVG
jgi:hypothetical protein